MGKLVLTRRAGESVKLTEPNGETWTITGEKVCGNLAARVFRPGDGYSQGTSVFIGQSMSFAGGSLELRPTKRRWPDQAILAFDFPRDVSIVRTEIA